MPGAEPWSHTDGPIGVLVSHGFTGTPHTVRPLAEAFAAAGFSVELPLLPGHGTSVDDMMTTGWSDWSQAIDAAYSSLRARCDKVAVAGLSMGGTLVLWLAERHPEIAAVVAINALVQAQPDEVLDMVRGMIAEGEITMGGLGSDIADPESQEVAYDLTPLPPLLSLQEALPAIRADLAKVTQPLLLMNSPQDHVVEPVNSDIIAQAVRGAVERVSLERSYHVATLDYDRELLCTHAVEFLKRVIS